MAIQHQARTPTGWNCPKCNEPLVWRYSAKTVKWFMGCSDFPRCTGTREEDGSMQRRPRQTVTGPGIRADYASLHSMLIASVLASDDEVLTFSQQQLDDAKLYDLHLDAIAEEQSFVVTVQKKEAS